MKKTEEAKQEAEKEDWEEKIDVAIIDVERNEKNPKLDDIIKELKKSEIIEDESKVNRETGAIITKDPSYEITGKLDDYLESFSFSGVNAPELAEGMIPIKHDGTKWIICEEDDPEWYEYIDQSRGTDGTSKWANIMLSDGKYKAGSTETENARKNKTKIKEEELGSMFVWIPRYAYRITSLYHSNSTDSAGEIDVEFLQGTKKYKKGDSIKSGNLANESGEGNWNEHPAFTFGDRILSGFWVAKFQASKTENVKVQVLPGKQVWNNMNISGEFYHCVSMNSEENASLYGISTNDDEIDPHLLKDNEWGAVAYLAQSSYGRNGTQLTPNTNGYDGHKYVYTGYAGEGTSAASPRYEKTPPENVHYYDTPEGMLASTTGNITGIYDMSGGGFEHVAGYVENGHELLKTHGNDLVRADSKYKSAYKALKADGEEATAGNDNSTKNYEAMKNIYGNALWETSGEAKDTAGGWYADWTLMPYEGRPFFSRGNSYYTGSESGLYYLYASAGSPSLGNAFRPSIAVR